MSHFKLTFKRCYSYTDVSHKHFESIKRFRDINLQVFSNLDYPFVVLPSLWCSAKRCLDRHQCLKPFGAVVFLKWFGGDKYCAKYILNCYRCDKHDKGMSSRVFAVCGLCLSRYIEYRRYGLFRFDVEHTLLVLSFWFTLSNAYHTSNISKMEPFCHSNKRVLCAIYNTQTHG